MGQNCPDERPLRSCKCMSYGDSKKSFSSYNLYIVWSWPWFPLSVPGKQTNTKFAILILVGAPLLSFVHKSHHLAPLTPNKWTKSKDSKHFIGEKCQSEYDKVILDNLCLIHNHPLSCTKLKISTASTTPLLKTTLFLWFHISNTIATHVPFHALFAHCRRPIIKKHKKWIIVDSCLTVTFPTHLSHWSQTFYTTLQIRNQCWLVSSPSWHNRHNIFVSCMSLLTKLTLVGSLSNNSLHACTNADGAIFIFHNNLKTLEVCIWSSLFNTMDPDLTEQTCWSSPTHTFLSWPFLHHRTLEIVASSWSSSFFSQTHLSLRQPKFQLGLSPFLLWPQLVRSPTIFSLHWEIIYSLGNFSFNTWPSTHLSSQNLTSRPSPKIQ